MKWLRFQWHAFGIVCGLLMVCFGWHVWHIRGMYLSADVRNHVREIVETDTADYGLPVSSAFVSVAQPDFIRVCYRDYMRGTDAMRCDDHSSITIPQ